MHNSGWLCVTVFLILFICRSLVAGDWPMWRHDARRTAATADPLPDKLHLQWTRKFPALQPAWPDQPKLQFDAVYEPVVLSDLLFVGSPRADWIQAIETTTGKTRWRFVTDGPIRFAPAAWKDRVFVVSDDGYLYCLNTADGKLRWKFRGGPNDRKILGNGRLISTWPARGAPVVADGTVYFAAGIWPFMGIFLHALDADTGRVIWTNDGDGSRYMRQPHHTDSFAGVAPQGPLAVLGDRLIAPGGRSVPAVYDRKTGKLLTYELDANGKRGGGFDVDVAGEILFNGDSAFDLKTQRFLGHIGKPRVLTRDVIYAHQAGKLRAFDLKSAGIRAVTTIDRHGKKIRQNRWGMTQLAECDTGPIYDCIKAGHRLYAGGDGRISVVALDKQQMTVRRVIQLKENTKVLRLIAGNERLFAVTADGRLCCFGADKNRFQDDDDKSPTVKRDRNLAENAKSILQTTSARDGFAIAWDIDENLLTELIEQSNFHWVVFSSDQTHVNRLRNSALASGIYGTRVAIHLADRKKLRLAPYFASFIISQKPIPTLMQSLRPYGGTYCLLQNANDDELRTIFQETQLANAAVRHDGNRTSIAREGPLPGSANWTHEHADAANTRVSKDEIVKAPLGVLWFGGSSNEGILPRHGHGPQPQVIDGRLIIEGVDFLRAMDVYTGRVLWQKSLPGLGDFYNVLSHQPGANAGGSNYVSLSDGIYVAYRNECLRLEPATGNVMSRFRLPISNNDKKHPKWGYINVRGDFLVGGAEPLFHPNAGKRVPSEKLNLFGKLLNRVMPNQNDNFSSSRHLVVMNRHTGNVLWKISARAGFRHNATCIGGGRLYTIDRHSAAEIARLRRRGKPADIEPRLLVFDLKTGKEIWSTKSDVFGTWLSYSAKRDILVEAGRVARDSLADEAHGMRAYVAKTGNVLWCERKYLGPGMIHGDTILTGNEACDLRTGKPKMRQDPLTGKMIPWKWQRNYGCNTPAASQNLLTFRSGAAGYFDLCRDGGTGNFGGFRSSCTNNLIVANGVLTAADYTRTCTCNYQNQTSLALVPMADAEMWTFTGSRNVPGTIKHLGVNLGAPGDRRDENGTLWLDYPDVGGNSPSVAIETNPKNPSWFRRHSSVVAGDYNWVTSSGVIGLRQIRIELSQNPMPRRRYTVRLFFAEPKHLQVGQRLITISLQGEEKSASLDVVKKAGGSRRSTFLEFHGIEATRNLVIELTPAHSSQHETLLCGIEIHEK